MAATVYVPVVKAKRNDLASLRDVSPANRQGIRPLLELAEYDSTDTDEVLGKFLDRLAKFSWPIAPYVDLYSFLPDACVSSGMNATVAGFRQIAARGNSAIPTYGFERNDTIWGDIGVAARRLGNGFCFRIDIEDLDDQAENTWAAIIERSAQMQFSAKNIDVVIDLRYIGETPLQKSTGLVREFLRLQPREFTPRVMTVVGSSALKTVSSVPKDGSLAVRRQELLLWSALQAERGSERQIAFGDYGVVHPDFSQSAPSPNANAKIRYTRGDSIHYFRGTRLCKPSNFGQYHGLAHRVISSPQYRGSQYSVGDLEIWKRANRNIEPGNLGTWVHIDQNHHVETTISQIRQALRAVADGVAALQLVEVLQGV